MSYREDMKSRMAMLLERDAEGWARLQGLMATLALPQVASGARRVEVEVAPDTWVQITSCAFDSEKLTFWCGVACVVCFEFRHTEPVPRWRMDAQPVAYSTERR